MTASPAPTSITLSRVVTRSEPRRTTVYSSNSGVCPGSTHPLGLFIRATLHAEVFELTRPMNSSIRFGLLPAASMTDGCLMCVGMRRVYRPRAGDERLSRGGRGEAGSAEKTSASSASPRPPRELFCGATPRTVLERRKFRSRGGGLELGDREFGTGRDDRGEVDADFLPCLDYRAVRLATGAVARRRGCGRRAGAVAEGCF